MAVPLSHWVAYQVQSLLVESLSICHIYDTRSLPTLANSFLPIFVWLLCYYSIPISIVFGWYDLMRHLTFGDCDHHWSFLGRHVPFGLLNLGNSIMTEAKTEIMSSVQPGQEPDQNTTLDTLICYGLVERTSHADVFQHNGLVQDSRDEMHIEQEVTPRLTRFIPGK